MDDTQLDVVQKDDGSLATCFLSSLGDRYLILIFFAVNHGSRDKLGMNYVVFLLSGKHFVPSMPIKWSKLGTERALLIVFCS